MTECGGWPPEASSRTICLCWVVVRLCCPPVFSGLCSEISWSFKTTSKFSPRCKLMQSYDPQLTGHECGGFPPSGVRAKHKPSLPQCPLGVSLPDIYWDSVAAKGPCMGDNLTSRVPSQQPFQPIISTQL